MPVSQDYFYDGDTWTVLNDHWFWSLESVALRKKISLNLSEKIEKSYQYEF
jgi:hypothetical protein